MPLHARRFERATAQQAATALHKAPGTIRSWGTRYAARKVTRKGTTWYDLRDLRIIEREIRHGHPVPATPEARDAIRLRCPLLAAESGSSSISAA